MRGFRQIWPFALLAVASPYACSSSESSSSDPSNAGKPNGGAACYAKYFAKVGVDCGGGRTDCGPALDCEIAWDCLSCADRCVAHACTTDDDCAKTYGALCDGVEWRCERYITAGNNRCQVADPGSPRCGNGKCEPAGGETCESCSKDCGFCPGKAPLGAACSKDADCASGQCRHGAYCSRACTSGYDCIDHAEGSRYTECVEETLGSGARACLLGCGPGGVDCGAVKGSACVSRKNEFGTDVSVCAAGSGASGENTVAACKDAKDNDGDGYIDCDDAECCSLVDCSTKPTSYCAKSENTVSKCTDKKDNDGDGFIDCDDSNCCAVVDCKSQPASYCGKK